MLARARFRPDQAEETAKALTEAPNAEVVTKADLTIALADLLKWMVGLLIAQGGVIVPLVKVPRWSRCFER